MFLAVPCSASAEITRPRVVRDLANTQTHQGQRISILFHVSAEELVTLSLLLWYVCISLREDASNQACFKAFSSKFTLYYTTL